jgi:hypothetical protein
MQVTLFTPHLGQKKVIDGFADSEHKFGVVSCGRQFGKSLLGQNLMLYWLLSKPNQKAGWVSPIFTQSKKVFKELEAALRKIIKSSNKADLTITFINGSTIQFLGAERYDSIRGFSFNYVVVDEAAFIREEAINEAILPTLSAIGKKCLIISTPKSKNWFYSMYLKGTSLNDTHIAFRGVSKDNPYVDQEFINEQQKSLPIDIYLQEYEAIFSESTNDVFRGLDAVCNLNEYEQPRRSSRYYFGVDIGLSDDFTVCTILNESGRTANILRFNGKTFEDAGKAIIDIVRRYNCKGGFIETNGIGKAIYEQVRASGIKCQGFTTTQESKLTAVRGLIQDIEDGVLELPSKQLMPEMYNELSAYTYKVNTNGKLSFSHPNGYKDDCVDSLWLANEARNKMIGGAKGKLYIGGQVKTQWG